MMGPFLKVGFNGLNIKPHKNNFRLGIERIEGILENLENHWVFN